VGAANVIEFGRDSSISRGPIVTRLFIKEVVRRYSEQE
jgi:hypothetical protein